MSSENHPAPATCKPCPFCGKNELIVHTWAIENDGTGIMGYVKCDNIDDCGEAQGPMSEYKYDNVEEAIEDATARWNRRA